MAVRVGVRVAVAVAGGRVAVRVAVAVAGGRVAVRVAVAVAGGRVAVRVAVAVAGGRVAVRVAVAVAVRVTVAMGMLVSTITDEIGGTPSVQILNPIAVAP